ncbi:MAG: hypothetical protein FJ271_05355 [Planctomycetes bacterium]|nr:hypothetical protein [Planctomycetota bacterium]
MESNPVIRYNYNAQINPPAPFVLVTLKNVLTGAEAANLPAQLDCAADRTLLSRVVEALGLPTIGSIQIGGVGGTIAEMLVYAVRLSLHDLPERDVEVVAHLDESWILLGRDVLNFHRIVLDGPRLALELQ